MSIESRAPASVDVLIPAFNAGRTVEASVRSMCNQTVRDIRIIVIDDGSTDDTPEILRRLAQEDRRIEIISTPNRGIVDALNTGLKAVQADLIARFDADDLAYPERLAVQCAYLREHPDCVAVGCNVHFIDESDRQTGKWSYFPFQVPRDPYFAPALEPYLLHPFLLVRRKAMEQTGAYRYAFHSEDADLYWRLGNAGGLINLPDFLGEYRVHSRSVSGSSVLNGRVQAVASQLAAVSEQRRLKGEPDIEFPREALTRYKEAGTLAGILRIASIGLTPAESAYLSIATTAKLLELSSYRPYRLETSDFATMRVIIHRHHRLLSRQNRMRLLFRQVILPNGVRSWPELSSLMPLAIYPRALLELVAHVATKTRRRLGAGTA